MLRPASHGTGLIASGSIRAVLECAGVTDVLAKALPNKNATDVVYAAIEALKQLREPETAPSPERPSVTRARSVPTWRD
ncbi:hypothetical protein [Propioniciclava flava]